MGKTTTFAPIQWTGGGAFNFANLASNKAPGRQIASKLWYHDLAQRLPNIACKQWSQDHMRKIQKHRNQNQQIFGFEIDTINPPTRQGATHPSRELLKLAYSKSLPLEWGADREHKLLNQTSKLAQAKWDRLFLKQQASSIKSKH